MARSIFLPPKVWSNADEASRHHACSVDDDVSHPHRFLIRKLVQQYIQNHREDFTEKQDGQYVFSGGGTKNTDSATDLDGSIIFSLVDHDDVPDDGTVLDSGIILRDDDTIAGLLDDGGDVTARLKESTVDARSDAAGGDTQ
jgi:hypothetical protein